MNTAVNAEMIHEKNDNHARTFVTVVLFMMLSRSNSAAFMGATVEPVIRSATANAANILLNCYAKQDICGR